jgi:hypothetical protein
MSYYFNRETWSLNTTPPGVRINAFLALMISALMGLAFLIFLPAIGFGLVFWYATRELIALVPRVRAFMHAHR